MTVLFYIYIYIYVCVGACVCMYMYMYMYIDELYALLYFIFILYMLVNLSAVCLVTELNFYLLTYVYLLT